jgi:SAM-dependent methyltransferase
MVEIARRACPDAEFHVGDAMNLPFADQEFDVVVCSLGILHFANPEKAILEAKRVLRSGGKYAITCWTPPSRNPFMGLVLGAVQKYGTTDVPLPPGPPLFRFGEPAECERTLGACGMHEIRTTQLDLEWDFPAAEQVVPAILGATARLSPLLALQAPEARKSIEAAIAEGARGYEKGGKVAIPAPVTMAICSKP